jgi:acetylornithine aminotransferase
MFIREVRAEGLMVGIELSVEGAPLVSEAMERGLLINCTHDFTLRLLPPFIITPVQVREFLKLFEAVLAKASTLESTSVTGNSRVSHGAAQAAARG